MAGGYTRTRKGKRTDIRMPKAPRSSWEANLIRVLKYLQQQGVVTHWEYECHEKQFPGKSEEARGNKVYHDDFYVTWNGDLGLGLDTPIHDGEFDFYPGEWIEVKGRLPLGGRLDRIDLSVLDERGDKDSRLKLDRLRRHYKREKHRVNVIGEREYRAIQKKFKPLIPEWES